MIGYHRWTVNGCVAVVGTGATVGVRFERTSGEATVGVVAKWYPPAKLSPDTAG